jgi:hypothetical protein
MKRVGEPKAGRRPRVGGRAFAWGLSLALAGLAALAGLLAWRLLGEHDLAQARDRTPAEWGRHLERRLQGHPRLEAALGPWVSRLHDIGLKPPSANGTELAKGQSPQPLGPVAYDAQGRPRPHDDRSSPRLPAPRTRVADAEALARAMAAAEPGDAIEIAPGRHRVLRTLHATRPGTAALPILVFAAVPGSVVLLSETVQGVIVSAPHWQFANLDWQGACPRDAACEHAYHVVGDARSTAILNNRLQDFNAALKVNGEGGRWPDDGLLQHSILLNTRVREVNAPVSGVDLVGANGWQLLDNRVEGIVRRSSDPWVTAYGVCVKGAAERTLVARNLVMCSRAWPWPRSPAAGISLGCGGTGREFCRDGRCDAETVSAKVGDNVVAHCSDFGIDANMARSAQLVHNTVVNTQGIDLRGRSTEAVTTRNLVEGRIRTRAGAASVHRSDRTVRDLGPLLADPLSLDLRWRTLPADLAPPASALDFCGRVRPDPSPPGATVQPRC